MQIAIVGSGISGLTAAYYLNKAGYDVHVFEADNYIGGHAHTVEVSAGQRSYPVDTGFIVFNDQTYPNFISLLNELNIDFDATDMSFSVYNAQNGFQYAGGSFSGLFAQRRNLISPKFYRFLLEIQRFQKLAKNLLKEDPCFTNLEEFITQNQFKNDFCACYLYPLIGALWSAPDYLIDKMPIYFIAKFFHNHSLLNLLPNIKWNVIRQGSERYVAALTKTLKYPVQLNTAVTEIKRNSQCHELYGNKGLIGVFDEVIIATHSDDALSMLPDCAAQTREILSAFSYQDNEVILHQDQRLLPSNHRAWASWNYWIAPENKQQTILTYNMNLLQHLPDEVPCYLSLNAAHLISSDKILQRFHYRHPQYTSASLAAQSRQNELNQHAGLYFCGAYWGYGFHEDGVNSALAVCQQLMDKLNK
jgi:uncharacterized protein